MKYPVPEEYAGVLNEEGHLLHSKGSVTRSPTLFFDEMQKPELKLISIKKKFKMLI